MVAEIVDTQSGSVKGRRLDDGTMSFRGIPYAAPPVGALRWCPPAPIEPWSGVRDARSFGADAFQVAGVRESRASGMSEDCLFLNVWTPAEHRPGGWPVIVWSGGGAFSTGGGAFLVEDLSRLAAGGAVVVSFNYRLGIFGFLAHPALSAESSVGSSGNYGLMDHAAALKWVRENIAAFGGDGSRITYMAESSGAAAGLLMLTSTQEARLFDQAIFLSPGSVTPLLTLAEAEQSAASLKGSADELRAIPAEELLAKTKQLAAPPSNLSVARPLRPIVDGRFITTDQAYRTGDFHAVPAIIGTNEDEGSFFTRRMTITTREGYAGYLAASFGDWADRAAERYPAADDSEVASALAEAYGDISINLPVDRLAKAFATREPRIFRFVYTYRHGGMTRPPTHAEEAETFLDNRPHVTPRDAEMAATIGRYLIAFAERGIPAAAGLPDWPSFDATEERYLRLDLPLAQGQRWRSDHMAFIARAAA